MSIIGSTLPRVSNRAPEGYRWETAAPAIEAWAAQLFMAAEDATVIDVFGVIGEDFWGDGVTEADIAAALKPVSGRDIRVRINSPGGDVFAGVAIYNLLAAHDGKVTVEVLGIAASAASVIAMAGDEILMGTGTKIMIHEAWGIAVGNKRDMQATSEILAGVDGDLVSIYEARTGLKDSKISAMMEAETYMNADQAIKEGFATGRLTKEQAPKPEQNKDMTAVQARRQIEAALAKQGVPRKEREAVIARMLEVEPPRDARPTNTAARDAGDHIGADEIAELCNLFTYGD